MSAIAVSLCLRHMLRAGYSSALTSLGSSANQHCSSHSTLAHTKKIQENSSEMEQVCYNEGSEGDGRQAWTSSLRGAHTFSTEFAVLFEALELLPAESHARAHTHTHRHTHTRTHTHTHTQKV